jgi:pantetheine-phosphate adenylyltransferase
MKEETKCVYGGTFDPFTNGHYEIILKALQLFDKVIVVIANNPAKNSMFTPQERLDMIGHLINHPVKLWKRVSVGILPEHEYLATYALRNGAKYLVRGIRDTIDFPYEQNICRTNKKICEEVETVYFMADDSHSLVSSSWVKGLIGMNCWCNVLKDAVPSCVLDILKENYLKKEIKKILIGICHDTSGLNNIWNAMQAYKDRDYHNFDHILSGLEAFKTHKRFIKTTCDLSEKEEHDWSVMLYAWLMHDIDDNEDKSIRIADDLIHGISPSARLRIKEFISATKHAQNSYMLEQENLGEEYENDLFYGWVEKSTKDGITRKYTQKEYDCAFFASIDLLCLGLPMDKYNQYLRDVKEEIVQKILKGMGDITRDVREAYSYWDEGRKSFLEDMLNTAKRPYIYPFPPIRKLFEAQARENLKGELSTLCK